LDNPRLQILRQLLEQDPANTFARYGLAMEHVKAGELEGAVKEFEAVLAVDPNYSAAYYHGGQTLEKLGKFDEARGMYRRGIAVTRDAHALSELQAALDILGD
jgi:tetratricopeptide (TPR) repeat protein